MLSYKSPENIIHHFCFRLHTPGSCISIWRLFSWCAWPPNHSQTFHMTNINAIKKFNFMFIVSAGDFPPSFSMIYDADVEYGCQNWSQQWCGWIPNKSAVHWPNFEFSESYRHDPYVLHAHLMAHGDSRWSSPGMRGASTHECRTSKRLLAHCKQ